MIAVLTALALAAAAYALGYRHGRNVQRRREREALIALAPRASVDPHEHDYVPWQADALEVR